MTVAGRFAIFMLVCMGAQAATNAHTSACSAPEYRQLDFWVGDWDVFEVGGKQPVARVQVDRILDGCALREQYEDNGGKQGQSFSIYDASRKRWHQTWVTNMGQLLVIEGELEGDSMVLRGESQESSGKTKRVRGIWKPVPDGVRETAVTSIDGGKSWQQWFDLSFRPRAK